MNKKTMKKVLAAVVTFLMVMVTLTQMSFAATGGFDPNTITPTTPTNVETFKTFGAKLIGALQAVGSVLAVVILGVLGIKYMMGSAEEKADYKKSMIPYVIGAAVLFLAPSIASIVYNFLQ